jgi:hypothetical protein
MTKDKKAWAELLCSLKGEDETLVWISARKGPLAAPDFVGKTGWLRFIGEVQSGNLTAGQLPGPDERVLMSGEWIDGNATIRAQLRGDTTEQRTISEDSSQGDIPVLRHTIETRIRDIPDRPGSYMQIAVYTGFRSQSDFEEGRLAVIAERFVGFSNDSLNKGAK